LQLLPDRLLEYDPNDRLPAIVDAYELGISLAGMSKAYALPGIRVGWLCTRCKSALQRFRKLKQYTTICGGTPNELLARIALANGQEIIARNLSILQKNLRQVEAFFGRNSERFSFVAPRAGTVSFPKLALVGDDAMDYCTSLAREHALVLVPPEAMVPLDIGQQLAERIGPRFRIGFGRTTLPELLRQWDAAVAAEHAALTTVDVVAAARL
jgi:aspartate/methionine/tyrosine aminotransferase